MKIKHIIVIFIISLVVIGMGALAKLQHWSMAGSLLTIGMFLQTTSYIIAIVKVLTMKKFKDFLNS